MVDGHDRGDRGKDSLEQQWKTNSSGKQSRTIHILKTVRDGVVFWWGRERVVNEQTPSLPNACVTHQHTDPCLCPLCHINSSPSWDHIVSSLEPCIMHEHVCSLFSNLTIPSVILLLLCWSFCLSWNILYSKSFVKETHCRSLLSQVNYHGVSSHVWLNRASLQLFHLTSQEHTECCNTSKHIPLQK